MEVPSSFKIICSRCEGAGWIAPTEHSELSAIACPDCKGIGIRAATLEDSEFFFPIAIQCSSNRPTWKMHGQCPKGTVMRKIDLRIGVIAIVTVLLLPIAASAQCCEIVPEPILAPAPCNDQTPWFCQQEQLWLPVVMAESTAIPAATPTPPPVIVTPTPTETPTPAPTNTQVPQPTVTLILVTPTP